MRRRAKKKTLGFRQFITRSVRLSPRPALIGAFVALAALGGIWYWYARSSFAVSEIYTFSSQSEWESGEYWLHQLDTKTSAGDISIASGSVGSWDAGTPGYPANERGNPTIVPEGTNYGADLVTDGYYVYMIVGGRQPGFFRYNPDTNTWKSLADAPTSFYYGSALTYYDGKIYAINGQEGDPSADYSAVLFSYDIATDLWTRLADAPSNWGLGSDIISGRNGKLYAVKGQSTDFFWSYNISNDTWSDTLPSIPAPYQIYTTNSHTLEFSDVSYGGPDPVNCEAGCIYAFRGNNNRQFLRFDIQLNQWVTGFADIPSAIRGIHYGSSMAFDDVNGMMYAFTGGNDDEFVKYDIANETWDADTLDTPDAPRAVYYGGALVYLQGYVYGTLGSNLSEFVRYDVTAGEWNSIVSPAASSTNVNNPEDELMAYVPNGADCADADGCLFLARGSNSNTFWRYDIGAKTWNSLTNITASVYYGGSLCYDGNNNIFIARGANTTSVYNYSISGNSFSSLTSPGAIGNGGAITCLGDNNFYLLRGNNQPSFYHYNGSWTTETNIPVAQANLGAAATNDGTYIYVMAGNLRGSFFRFEPGVGWTELPGLPTSSYYTGTLEYDGVDSIYAIAGRYEKDFWRYDITDQTWNRITDLPGRFVNSHAAAHDDANDILYLLRGFGTSSIYRFNTETDAYIPSANWVSPIIDLTYVSSFTSFGDSATTPGSTSFTYESRTSDDKVNWSAWQTITGGTSIQSPTNRYIQIKITFNSDDTNTPTLSSFSITYEKDSVDPTNPTITGYSNSGKTATLNSGSSYYHTNPYFEFSGASDAESGVVGYYVAWTTNATLDPSADEDYFQTSESFEVNTSLQTSAPGPNYYLRIATKDGAGNVSTPQTAFTYVYSGISPASATTWTTQGDFETSGTSGTNVNTAANSGVDLTLSSITDGVWTNEAPTPNNVSHGASLAYDGNDTLYFVRGTNSQEIYAYSISQKTYTQLTNYGVNVYNGSSMVYIPSGAQCADATGCLFVTRGATSQTFQRYNIAAATWSPLTDVPGVVNYGSSIAWGQGNYLYVTRGNNSSDLYRYSISGNSWTSLTSTDQTLYYGSTLVYVAPGDYCADPTGCLFATRGNSDSDLYQYNISENSWIYLTNAPIWTQYGASSYYLNGALYLVRGYLANDFLKYDIANDSWSYLDEIPTNHYQGSTNGLTYVPSTDTMYLLRGYSDYSLFAYDVSEDRWKTPSLPQDISNTGFYYGAVAYDSNIDQLYVSRGQNYTDWWAFHIDTDEWEELADVPMRVYQGADASVIDHASNQYDGVYLMNGAESLGDSVGYFFRYSRTTDLWTRLADLPAEPGLGADLVWDGVDTLYSPRGQNTTTYYKYTISTNTWDTVASTVPGAVYQGGCQVNGGDGYIYLVRGQNTANIYRFNISTETWDAAGTLTSAPGNFYYGDACVLDGQGNILIPRGNNTTDMYVYNIAGDSWSTRSVLQYFEYGELAMTSNNVILGFRGESTSALQRYVVATSTTGFEGNGSWTSQILDFGTGAYGYAGLSLDVTNPANTSVSLETRTCSDAGCAGDENDAHWSDWAEATSTQSLGSVTSYTVASSVAQYGQVRIRFVSDQLYTSSVHSLSWSSYSDGTAPNNPSAASAYTDSGKTTGITDNTWTAETTPYFEWSSTDNTGGIGVQGAYVYFGTNSALDPVDDADDATNLAYKSGTNFYNASSGTVSWDASTQASGSLSSGTYYLKVKTQDFNTNVTASAASIFTYKIDTQVPTDPSGVSADPAGYTSVNNFDFSWTASSDTHSGVTQYCWKTGDVGSTDTCIDSSITTVTDILAYQTRGNTFYVRAKDNAGNYSNYATTTYFYAGDAPTEPLTLVATPTTAENTNAFSFSWSLPNTCLGRTPCQAADIIRYCYTINELPSQANCGTNLDGNATPSPDGGWTTSTQTSNRLLPAFSAATQQDVNTLYLVAADAINNIDYANYAEVNYTFTSTAPGPPASLQATDSSDRASEEFSTTLTWSTPSDVGDGVELYKIYRCDENSTDCDNPSSSEDPPTYYTNIANTTTRGYLDVELDTTITYRYFVRAIGPGNAPSGNSAVVSIKPEGKFVNPPLIIGQVSAVPKVTTAEMEWLTADDVGTGGVVIPHPASSFVEYGETTAYGNETGSSELVNAHSVTITGLAADTTYHARAFWIDVDGNRGESSDFEFTTLGAPSAPTNVTVDPTTNTANRFTFSWDAPSDEGIEIGGYFYSVNTLPNETNAKFTANTSVGPFRAATQQDKNTFYVVASDTSANVDFDNYATVEFEAHTTPPEPPLNLFIEDSSNRDTENYLATLTWSEPGIPTSTGGLVSSEEVDEEISYEVYRKAEGEDDFSKIASVSSTAYLDAGLEGGKTYEYTVTAADSAGATSDQAEAVDVVPTGRYTTPPDITQGPTVTADSFSAKVEWDTERPTSSFIEFGLTADLGDEQGTSDLISDHSVIVTGLKPTTTYYYRVKSIDIDENVGYSSVGSFTTLEAPRVLDAKISNIRLFDATITWTTNKETTTALQYGTTTNYGFTVNDTSGSFAFTHTLQLQGLADGTTYNVQLTGTDRSGNAVQSDNYVFTTLTFPRILSFETENKAEGETEVRWTTNVPTTSLVEYYNETSPPKTQGNTALVTDHAILLFGLEDATVYNYTILGEDQFGNKVESDENNFRTLEDTTPPIISNVKVESNTIGSGEASRVQIIVSFRTNEPTSTQVLYGQGSAGTTQETDVNGELVYDHLMVIQDLDPARTYVVKAVAVDKAGNGSESDVYTVLTSRSRDSFLQLIIANLEDTFAWLGNLTPG
ncbi:MAG: fibronectin type III domain-containing protein [Candidatus Nomurabacteria bacterium]|nr:MAG: fibronectin type III domain-containing protein [Candidatus Nomurabacteria bacterium]